MKSTFKWTSDGKLQHYIDEDLRATVEAKHLSEYCRSAGIEPDSIPPQP